MSELVPWPELSQLPWSFHVYQGILVACAVISALTGMFWGKSARDAKDSENNSLKTQIQSLERLSSPQVLDWLTHTKEIAEKRWQEVQEENEKQKEEIAALKDNVGRLNVRIEQMGGGQLTIETELWDDLHSKLVASTASIADLSASNTVTSELIQKATREMGQTFGDWLKLTAEEMESNQRMEERVIQFLKEHNGEHEYQTLYVFFDRDRTAQIQTVLQDMIANKKAVVENGIFKLTSF